MFRYTVVVVSILFQYLDRSVMQHFINNRSENRFYFLIVKPIYVAKLTVL